MRSIFTKISQGIFTVLLFSSISFAQFTIDGIEGIEFDPSNGDFSTTLSGDNVTVFGVIVAPVGLTFSYTSASNNFSISGTAFIGMDGIVGSDVSFLLSITDETVDEVTIGLTESFYIKGIEVSPENLTLGYDIANSQFEMYGDLSISILEEDVTANMGDADDPGLIFDGSTITHINFGVTTDFSLAGMIIEANDVGIEWDSESSELFNIYGDASLNIDGESVDADFGDSEEPGIVISSSQLESFEVDVNSDLTLGNLEVIAEDVDIKYSEGVFEVTGKITIEEVFSVSVTLGSDDAPGLEIDVSGSAPKFKIDDLTIDIEHANLGTIDLKNFELEFNSDGIVESDLDVVLPSGTEIDGRISFKDVNGKAELDGISVSYTATNIDDAVEIFAGVQMVYVEGSVENLTKPSDLEVSAEMDLIYGGGFSLEDEDVTLLETSASVDVNSEQLQLEADVNVGAYQDGDDWKSLLGDGSITLKLYFSGSAVTEVKIDIPSDPLVKVDAEFYLNTSGDFDGLIDVSLYVPSSVPFIGGDKLGSVDGAIRYKADDLGASYAAGWTEWDTFWHDYYLGAKYKFKSRSISTFSGKSHVSDIKDDIEDDINGKAVNAATQYTISTHTFDVYDDPVTPSMLLITADWGKEIDSVLVNVVGPEGIYELTRAIALTDTNTTTVPDYGYEENMDWVTNDSSAVFVITTPSAFSQEEIAHATMIEGRYQVVVSLPADQAPDSVDLSVIPIFQSPNTDIAVSKSGNNYEVDLDYWSLIPDSTFLSLYVNTENSYDSARLVTHVEAENFDDFGYGTESITYNPGFLSVEDTLYFFAIIDDGYNPPETSDIANPFVHEPDFYGTISFPQDADSLKAGLRIFIDEDVDKSFDVHSTGGLEKFGISSSEGNYSISGLEPGTYEVRIVLPPGYRISGGVDRFSHHEITFDGTPINHDFIIEAVTQEAQ